MKKRLLASILAILMILSLAACGKKEADGPGTAAPAPQQPPVTAEQDVQKVQGKDEQHDNIVRPAEKPEDVQPTPGDQGPLTAESVMRKGMLTNVLSMEGNMTIGFDATIDMSDELEGDQSMSMSMKTDVNCDFEVQNQADGSMGNQHLNGVISLEMMGMEYSDRMESYQIRMPDGSFRSYDWSSETDSWTYADGSADADDGMSGLLALGSVDPSIIKNLTLLPVSDADTIYTVTGSVSIADMNRSTGVSSDDLFGMTGAEEDVPENASFDLVFTYDRATGKLSSLYMALDPYSFTAETGSSINTFSINIIIYSVNNTVVSVPNDVAASATPEGPIWDDDADLNIDYDTGYNTNDPEP